MAVAKLGEIVLLPNESGSDTSLNLTAQVGTLLAGAAGPAAGVPSLNDCLLYNASRAWLILRNDFEVAMSMDYAFHLDSMAVRVRGRFAAGIPAIAKTIRKLTVSGADRRGPASRQARRLASGGGKRE